MAISAYNKFNNFVLDLGKGVHNFTAHSLSIALSNTAPVATNTVLADITLIAGAALHPLDSVTWSQTGGTAKLVAADEVITASGGSIGPFQFLVVYNDTPTLPADPLICWFDYGSALTLNDGESLTVDFDGTNGVFTIA
jgi:hypothetical protein